MQNHWRKSYETRGIQHKAVRQKYLQHVNEAYGFELEFFDFLLSEKTAKTAHGCEGVCIFVNDDGSRPVLEELKKQG